MAYVHVKSDEQRAHEQRILNDFANRRQNEQPTKEQREAAEVIARRTAEAAEKNRR